MLGHQFLTLLTFCSLFVTAAAMPAHAQRSASNQGAQRFMEYCAACHGADGKGSEKAESIATTPRVMALSDAELTAIVNNGEASGMPPFAQIGERNIAAIVFYLRTLQGLAAPTNPAAAIAVTGDVNAGRTLFFGKGQCSTCHMIKGEGGFIASDLTAYGQDRTATAILRAILMPDKPLAPASRVVDVRTRNGKKLSGVLRNEDNFNLVLQTEDGRYHFLARSDLIEMHYTDHSLMPHDYGSRLKPWELNDIASFLIVTGRNNPTDAAPGRGRSGGN